jgi:hypothetical protein
MPLYRPSRETIVRRGWPLVAFAVFVQSAVLVARLASPFLVGLAFWHAVNGSNPAASGVLAVGVSVLGWIAGPRWILPLVDRKLAVFRITHL